MKHQLQCFYHNIRLAAHWTQYRVRKLICSWLFRTYNQSEHYHDWLGCQFLIINFSTTSRILNFPFTIAKSSWWVAGLQLKTLNLQVQHFNHVVTGLYRQQPENCQPSSGTWREYKCLWQWGLDSTSCNCILWIYRSSTVSWCICFVCSYSKEYWSFAFTIVFCYHLKPIISILSQFFVTSRGTHFTFLLWLVGFRDWWLFIIYIAVFSFKPFSQQVNSFHKMIWFYMN